MAIKIPAYDREQYWKNRGDGDKSNHLPCVVCGKQIPLKKARYWVHLHDGGALIVTDAEASEMPENADMGVYPVGSDCLRRYPEIKPYVKR